MDSQAKIVCDFLGQLKGFYKTGVFGSTVINMETGAVIKAKYSTSQNYHSGQLAIQRAEDEEILLIEINGHQINQHYREVVSLYLARHALLNEVMTKIPAKEEYQHKLSMLVEQFQQHGYVY